MSELLYEVLTDESARTAEIARTRLLKSAQAFTPWSSYTN